MNISRLPTSQIPRMAIVGASTTLKRFIGTTRGKFAINRRGSIYHLSNDSKGLVQIFGTDITQRSGVIQVRQVSQARLEQLRHIPSESLVWNAHEDDPTKHTSKHEGLFYHLPADAKELVQLFGTERLFSPEQQRFHKTLGRIPIMIRKPALNVMEYISKIKPSAPNVRMLMYGDHGTGKQHTLIHLLHYLKVSQDHIIVHINDARKIVRSPHQIEASTSRPGRIDVPLSAAWFLQHFRILNFDLLNQYKDKLVCSKDYQWSLREFTKAGEPLSNIADHGINRITHASDCMAVLLKELTLAADMGSIKLALVMNYTKFLFDEFAGVQRHSDQKKMLVDEITPARALKKLIKGTHKNGLVIASCDDPLSTRPNQTPREVLGLEGWNHFDPFLPIQVPNYSRKEFESCLNYYQDIGWISRPEAKTQEARDEIRFVSGLNPEQVDYQLKAI